MKGLGFSRCGVAASVAVLTWFAPGRCCAQDQCVVWREFQTTPLSSHLFYDLNVRRVLNVQEGQSNSSHLVVRQWTGSAWLDFAVSSGEYPRQGYAMAYDTARRRLVLFGGIGVVGSGQGYKPGTLEFNGATWSGRSSTGPAGRTDPAMAYDTARQRVVLFGGINDSGDLGDTWEWDGVAWQLRATTGVPARHGAQMAFDEWRKRIVLFGGIEPGNVLKRDTFEWDGEAWTKRNDALASESASSGILWDPEVQRVVMWGSDAASTVFDHRLEWTGDSWERTAFEGPPRMHNGVAPVYDPTFGEFVVQSLSGGYPQRPTWSGTEGNWTQRVMGAAEAGHSIAYDSTRDEFVGIVTVSQIPTTENRTSVIEKHPWGFSSRDAGSDPGGWRWGSQIAFHAGAGHAVSFGGVKSVFELTTYYHGDTILWDGISWTQSAAVGPTPRTGCYLAYDSARQRVVMFGGSGYAGSLHDTWEWDGASWTSIPVQGPTANLAPRLAYDSIRQRVVLYGAPGYSSTDRETWEYDGASWALRDSAGPKVRGNAAICFDAGLGKVVVFGAEPKTGGTGGYDQTFTWDGAVWKQLTNLKLTPDTGGTSSMTLLYDSAKERTLLTPGFYELSRKHDITRQPDAEAVNAGHSAAFLVAAADPSGVTYQWRRDGVPLADGGRLSGAKAPVLVISAVEPGDAGTYDVIVASTCASTTSAGATLAVLCPADVNRDGFVTGDDYDRFALDFWDGAPRADFDQNGFVNGDDIDFFVAAFLAGC